MFIPKNHEKLQVISEIVSDGLDKLEDEGGKYYDDRAYAVAQQAVHDVMPELVRLSGERVAVEAYRGIGVGDTENRTFNGGLFANGVLKSILIQQMVHQETLDDDMAVDTSFYDLCAVIVPRYAEADPQDIVFSSMLYVPFGTITKFEAAQ